MIAQVDKCKSCFKANLIFLLISRIGRLHLGLQAWNSYVWSAKTCFPRHNWRGCWRDVQDWTGSPGHWWQRWQSSSGIRPNDPAGRWSGNSPRWRGCQQSLWKTWTDLQYFRLDHDRGEITSGLIHFRFQWFLRNNSGKRCLPAVGIRQGIGNIHAHFVYRQELASSYDLFGMSGKSDHPSGKKGFKMSMAIFADCK